MINLKTNTYNRVLNQLSEKHDGAEDVIYSKIEEIGSKEKLCAEEVIFFLCILVTFLTVK